MSKVTRENQAKAIQARMKEMGYETFKLGQGRELVAAIAGEQSYNSLSAKEEPSKNDSYLKWIYRVLSNEVKGNLKRDQIEQAAEVLGALLGESVELRGIKAKVTLPKVEKEHLEAYVLETEGDQDYQVRVEVNQVCKRYVSLKANSMRDAYKRVDKMLCDGDNVIVDNFFDDVLNWEPTHRSSLMSSQHAITEIYGDKEFSGWYEDGIPAVALAEKHLSGIGERKATVKEHTAIKEALAYFVLETQKTDKGFIPCIAKENQEGYFPTDWVWNISFEEASKECDKMNEKMGVSKDLATSLIVKSMGSF